MVSDLVSLTFLCSDTSCMLTSGFRPGLQDLKAGIASLHEKFWATGPKELTQLWFDWRKKMEVFYDGKSWIG